MNDQDFITGEELGEKLLQSVREMQTGLGRVLYSPISEIRVKTGLSEVQFAELLGAPSRCFGNGSRDYNSLPGRQARSCKSPNGIPKSYVNWRHNHD
jgi:hypothetical protein